jgi:hypothetical protein
VEASGTFSMHYFNGDREQRSNSVRAAGGGLWVNFFPILLLTGSKDDEGWMPTITIVPSKRPMKTGFIGYPDDTVNVHEFPCHFKGKKNVDSQPRRLGCR